MINLYEFLVKGKINNINNINNIKYFIVVGWDDNFDEIYRFCNYTEYLDVNENRRYNPAAFIMNKKQIEEAKEYIDDVYFIPKEYHTYNMKEILDDWYDETLKIDDLEYIDKNEI